MTLGSHPIGGNTSVPVQTPVYPPRNHVRRLPKRIIYGAFALAIGLTGAIFAYTLVQHPQDLRSRAEVQPAGIILVGTNTMPPGRSVQLWASAGTHGVVFASVTIYFNTQAVRLSGEIDVNPVFQVVLRKTPASTANTSGAVTVTVALFDPATGTKPDPLTGSFPIAVLPFEAVSTQTNLTSDITIPAGQVQIGSIDSTQFLPVTVSPFSFILNYQPATATTTPPDSGDMTLPTQTVAPTFAYEPTAIPTDIPEPTYPDESDISPTEIVEPTVPDDIVFTDIEPTLPWGGSYPSPTDTPVANTTNQQNNGWTNWIVEHLPIPPAYESYEPPPDDTATTGEPAKRKTIFTPLLTSVQEIVNYIQSVFALMLNR